MGKIVFKRFLKDANDVMPGSGIKLATYDHDYRSGSNQLSYAAAL